VVRGDQALDSASAWHTYEEQGLWSGVMRYLTLPQPGIIQRTVFKNMSYTLHTAMPVGRNSEFSKHWRTILSQHS